MKSFWPAIRLAQNCGRILPSRTCLPARHALRFSTATSLPTNLRLFDDPMNDLVAEMTLPNGAVSLLKAIRLPKDSNEPSTACLLWGNTKDALDESGFRPTLPSASEPGMYTIGPSTLAGKGVFAARDIKRGETVVVERPLLVIPAGQPPEALVDAAEMQSWPWSELKPMILDAAHLFIATRLSKDEQEQVLALDSCDGSFWNIMSQNAIVFSNPLPGNYTAEHSALCSDISRINHSCTPNVQASWDPQAFAVSIHALRPIAKGDELLIAYGPRHFQLFTRHERQEFFENQYYFNCTCPSCSLPDDASATDDTTRLAILTDMVNTANEIETVLDEHPDDGRPDDLENDPVVTRWIEDRALPNDHVTAHSEAILESMNNAGVELIELKVIHFNRLLEAYIALGNAEKAKFWAARLLEFSQHTTVAALGVEEIERHAADPEKIKQWGIRRV